MSSAEPFGRRTESRGCLKLKEADWRSELNSVFQADGSGEGLLRQPLREVSPDELRPHLRAAGRGGGEFLATGGAAEQRSNKQVLVFSHFQLLMFGLIKKGNDSNAAPPPDLWVPVEVPAARSDVTIRGNTEKYQTFPLHISALLMETCCRLKSPQNHSNSTSL